MPIAPTVEEFLRLAHKSGVLDEKRFAERFPDPAALPADPQQAAAALVREGLLTPFQARQLLAGKFRGLVLGPYAVLRPLGQGGMGAVYLAEHTDLKRKVAVKLLPIDKVTDKLAVERFHREARAAAALAHPNIVRIDDVCQGAGLHFQVMEYVDGTDLQSLLAKTGPLPHAQAVHYVAQAAAGLQHAHEKGFVHRDVKPGNLILAKTGAVKVLDLGLARSFENRDDDLTGQLGDPREVAGTADYIAPEQAFNQAVDERTDVYSLGATLFALLTGHPPFKGTAAQKMAQHRTSDPPDLAKLRPELPPDLCGVVAKMMAKRPGGRYRSMADVIDALDPWLADGVTPFALISGTPAVGSTIVTGNMARALPPDEDEPAAHRTRRRLLIAGGAAAAAALLVAVVVFAAVRKSAGEGHPTAVAPPAGGPAVGSYLPLPLDKVANTQTAANLMGNPDAKTRLVFRDPGPKEFKGVPFVLIDPKDGAVNNAVILYSANRPGVTDVYPRSVVLPVGGPATAFHVLGGVAGWGWPYRKGKDAQAEGVAEGADSVVVRVRYADGQAEEHVWRNGEHLTDYNKRVDAPGSELAFEVEPSRFVRYLVVRPRRTAAVKEVEFAKAAADEYTAPIILAVTVERPAAGR